MIRGVFVAAVCAGLVWTAPATGAFMDGDRLLAKCNEDPGEELAVCVWSAPIEWSTMNVSA